MEASSLEAVLRGLNGAGVRYLIAGGLAVVAHGYVRFTKDLDLLIALDDANAGQAVSVFTALGYRPVVAAVTLSDFQDASKRRQWVEEKQAKVLTLFSDQHRLTPVDLFLEPPLDFEHAWSRAVCLEYAPGLAVAFVGREDLIAMKRLAGRPQDLVDIEALQRLGGT